MNDHPVIEVEQGRTGASISRRSMLGGVLAAAAAASAPSLSAGAAVHYRRGGAVFPSFEVLPRFMHTAVLMGDGSVFVAGGLYKGVLSDASIYNPRANGWFTAAPMHTARYNHAAVAISPTQVLVLGGVGASHQPLNDAEIYDYINDVWTPASPLQIPRHQHTATMMADGSVFIAGGVFEGPLSDFEFYMP